MRHSVVFFNQECGPTQFMILVRDVINSSFNYQVATNKIKFKLIKAKLHVLDCIQLANKHFIKLFFSSLDFGKESPWFQFLIGASTYGALIFLRHISCLEINRERSMAAYGALISLRHIIEQIQHHPHPPISLDKTQLKSLIENLTFLQEYLEAYPNDGSKEADDLDSFIADTAYQVQDMVEAQIVDNIQVHGEKIMSFVLSEGLQNMILEMALLIKPKVIEITSKPHASLRSPSSVLQDTTVGLDDIVIEIMDKLTGQQSNRQIIPIVGMGGIGKTTLAKYIYVNPLIVQYYDFCAWATISQEYSIRQILLEVVLCLERKDDNEILSQMSEHELGDKLYKCLFGRRYLVVMDDIWSIEAWDKVKTFFPNNNNGSAIMLTTRLSNLAFQLSGSYGLEVSFLDDDISWELLCKIVFGGEGFPLELEETGRSIAKNCKGLPLSIVVIGGLLAKSNQTREHWQYIAENLNSIVNFEDNEHCLKILRLSYNQLPIHLKPCFLYMGIFREDHKIHVSTLIKLWVAEGFLKPISGKSLEVAAKEYLNELIERNLILVDRLGSAGNIRCCTIHDLLRDLCIKEAEKDKFFCVAKTQSLYTRQDLCRQRRISIHGSTLVRENVPRGLCEAVRSASWARSLICDNEGFKLALPFRLLWVFSLIDEFRSIDRKGRLSAYRLEDIFQLVNLRHLAIVAELPKFEFPSSVYHLWNLQTFVVVNSENDGTSAPFDIWMMPQLRHVKIAYLDLPDPSKNDELVILENLQTLTGVSCFKCGEEVVKRIPNIKKLGIYYPKIIDSPSAYCLNNLYHLHKLESLLCSFYFEKNVSRSELAQSLVFPHSLKKLTLEYTHLHWEDVAIKIGSLPHLQVLKLKRLSLIGSTWETVEGQFPSLKYLKIESSYDLENWWTESTHFPCLEHLVLRDIYKLKQIPLEIGDTVTLKSIELDLCNHSIMTSAKTIVQEQEDIGNEGLQVRVRLSKENQEVESLASRNFIVELRY